LKRNSELGEERGGGGTIAIKTSSPRAACAPPPPDELPRARPGADGTARVRAPSSERTAGGRTNGLIRILGYFESDLGGRKGHPNRRTPPSTSRCVQECNI
jgi:hypothetical protein